MAMARSRKLVLDSRLRYGRLIMGTSINNF